MTEEQEIQSKIEDLEAEIRSHEENLCVVSVEIMDAKVAIEMAEEHYNGLLFQRKSIHSQLTHLRNKLEYAKDGLL